MGLLWLKSKQPGLNNPLAFKEKRTNMGQQIPSNLQAHYASRLLEDNITRKKLKVMWVGLAKPVGLGLRFKTSLFLSFSYQANLSWHTIKEGCLFQTDWRLFSTNFSISCCSDMLYLLIITFEGPYGPIPHHQGAIPFALFARLVAWWLSSLVH